MDKQILNLKINLSSCLWRIVILDKRDHSTQLKTFQLSTKELESMAGSGDKPCQFVVILIHVLN